MKSTTVKTANTRSDFQSMDMFIHM